MNAEEHLAELKKLSTATLKRAKIAARNEGLALVDAKRLADLESLLISVKSVARTAQMTRDYKDVLEECPEDRYNGKRYLLDRREFNQVMQALSRLEGSSGLPMGCLAD